MARGEPDEAWAAAAGLQQAALDAALEKSVPKKASKVPKPPAAPAVAAAAPDQATALPAENGGPRSLLPMCCLAIQEVGFYSICAAMIGGILIHAGDAGPARVEDAGEKAEEAAGPAGAAAKEGDPKPLEAAAPAELPPILLPDGRPMPEAVQVKTPASKLTFYRFCSVVQHVFTLYTKLHRSGFHRRVRVILMHP